MQLFTAVDSTTNEVFCGYFQGKSVWGDDFPFTSDTRIALVEALVELHGKEGFDLRNVLICRRTENLTKSAMIRSVGEPTPLTVSEVSDAILRFSPDWEILSNFRSDVVTCRDKLLRTGFAIHLKGDLASQKFSEGTLLFGRLFFTQDQDDLAHMMLCGNDVVHFDTVDLMKTEKLVNQLETSAKESAMKVLGYTS